MDKKKNIHAGHRTRMRERYLESGADIFRDHELFELLLSYSIAQKDTNPLGHVLIDHFGDLRGVLNATPEELLTIPGIGETSACLIKLISGMTRRYYEELADKDDVLDTTEKQIRFLIPRFIARTQECLFAAFLGDDCRLLRCELQYEGSSNAVEIYSERIVNTALRYGATQVIIAHNHSNEAVPSKTDVATTANVSEALRMHGILLLDHIIISGTTASSMKESGHYNPLLQKPHHLYR